MAKSATADRSHLVATKVVRADGVETTVHRRPAAAAPVSSAVAAAAAPVSAVAETAEEQLDELLAPQPAPQRKLAFVPDTHWGETHLSRRGLRIIRGLRTMDGRAQRDVIDLAERHGNDSAGSYSQALAASLERWRGIAGVRREGDLALDPAEGSWDGTARTRDRLTDMAEDEPTCRRIAEAINARADEDAATVDAADARAAVELLRDATSEEARARQTRAYVLRTRARDIDREVAELTAERERLTEPLRALDTGWREGKFSYDLGGDDDATIEFVPKTTVSEAAFLAEFTEEERAEVRRPVAYDYTVATRKFGKDRMDRARVPATTSMSVK